MADDNAYTAATMTSGFGNSPDVDEKTMEATNRVVTSIDQGVQMTETDVLDARKLIVNARRITAKKQGAPPYNPAALKAQAKGHKRNISTRFLQKELNRAAARFYMPILTASTMTAASLPAGWPKGQEKTDFFRKTITTAFRSWRKNDMYWRGLGSEVSDFGYTFACWTDPYEWRPHLVRMDKGFVPRGTEVMDDQLARFTLKWDYRPDELLRMVRDAVDSGSENWKKDSVAAAVDAATLPTMPTDQTQLRKWEELIRQQSWDYNYSRAQRVIQTRHLFVLEYTGKVSHYIFWVDGKMENRLIFEHLDAYESTDHVVIPLVFGYGDGTIHGSWGAGQLLYDLAAQVEKIRCDSIDNLLNSNKARLQVASAKDAASAELVINDTMIIAAGATFAQNVGGVAGNPEGYMTLDDKMTQWAQEVVGSYLPPIPIRPTDIKAAQVNAAKEQEDEVKKDVLEAWLKQVALVTAEMTRRITLKDSNNEVAIGIRKKLLGDNAGWIGSLMKGIRKIPMLDKIIPPAPISLSEEELDILVNQPAIQSVTEFTEYAAGQRAQFAASVQNNPLFNQAAVARYMAEGVPSSGDAFVDSIIVPEGDTTSQTSQQRQQMIENATMLVTKQALPVVVTDNHYIHWEGVVGPLEQTIMAGMLDVAAAGLQHASAHYAAGVATKTWPPDKINESKAQLARFQQAMEAKQQEQAQAQQLQQMQAQQAQAQQMQAQQGGGMPPGPAAMPPGAGMAPPPGMVPQ